MSSNSSKSMSSSSKSMSSNNAGFNPWAAAGIGAAVGAAVGVGGCMIYDHVRDKKVDRAKIAQAAAALNNQQ